MRTTSAALVSLLCLTACGDATEPLRPVGVSISGDAQSAPAGVELAKAPTLIVSDQNGKPLAGVPVTIAVTAGGGTVAGAPSASSAGATPVGTWTLGRIAGANELTVTVAGLAPAKISIAGVAGPPAKLVALVPVGIAGVVATPVTPGPQARLTDQFDNVVANAPVTVTVSGGSISATTVTSSGDGTVTAPQWTLGTARGSYTLTFSAGTGSLVFTTLAKSGPPASVTIVSGGSQSALAATALAQPIRVLVRDSYANPVDSVGVSFLATVGEGTLTAAFATTDFDGIAVQPGWILGKRASPQVMRAVAGEVFGEVTATVQTDFSIDLRFYATPPNEQRRLLFLNAGARLSAIVIGDLPNVQVTNLGVGFCGVPGVAPLTEVIDDVVIFSTIEPIDGPGNIVASAGPCVIRSGGGLPVIGRMRFDEADVASLEANGLLADVVTHEMLHVLGVGSLWSLRVLLSDANTANVGYVGAQGRQGCLDSGGSAVCPVTVPVENTGGSGTANAHWRETTFDTELMTGFIDNGPMPLSLLTVGGLADLGYQANRNAMDIFRVPGSGIRGSVSPLRSVVWERVDAPLARVTRAGRVEMIGERK